MGFRFITDEDAEQVRQMLRDKVPRSVIAKRMKMAAKTIAAIANGTWKILKRAEVAAQPRVDARRCPGCGGKIIVLPCQVCKLRGK